MAVDAVNFKVAIPRENATLQLFDIGPPRPMRTLKGSDPISTNLEISRDGRHIMYGLNDGTIRLRDISGDERGSLELKDLAATPVHLALSGDGKFLFVMHKTGDVVIWPLGSTRPTARRIGGVVQMSKSGRPVDPRIALFPGPNGDLFVAAGKNEFIVWDARTGNQIMRQEGAFLGRAGFSSDGRLLVFVRQTSNKPLRHAVYLTDIGSGTATALVERDESGVAAFAPGGDLVLVFGQHSPARHAQMWSLASNKLVAEWHNGRPSSSKMPKGWSTEHLYSQLIQLIEDSIITQTEGFTVHAPRRRNGLIRIALRQGNGLVIIDGRSWARALQQDLKSGMETLAQLAKYPVPRGVRSLAFTPDGRSVAVVGTTEPVTLWRTFPSVRELVEHARKAAPRCLSRRQRLEQLLGEEPPAWCIEHSKKPYHTPEWKAWHAGGRKSEMPVESVR